MTSLSAISRKHAASPRSPRPTGDLSIHDSVLERLRAAGLRYTTGRQRLVEILQHAGSPLTVNGFVSLDPRLPLSSVYRDLHHLRDVGVLARLSLIHDRHHFQFSAEVLGREELHFVCTGCASVTTVESPPMVDDVIVKTARYTLTSAFTVDRGRLALFGRCVACRS